MKSKNIKVLTLWEPWATLLIHGFKLLETRPGKTTHDGTYLIHAAKKWSIEQQVYFDSHCVHEALLSIGITDSSQFNLGTIIGECQFIKCREIQMINDHIDKWTGNMTYELTFTDGSKRLLSEDEEFFGNYDIGRWVWESINRRKLIEPLQYKGNQGYYANYRGHYNSLVFV